MSDLKLGVNIDHVATIREARYRLEKQAEPNVLFCANEAIRGGADSITAHLREDRRHIQDHDIVTLKENLNVPLNLEMANVQEIVDFAIEIKPKFICLVPEKRNEPICDTSNNPAPDLQARCSSLILEYQIGNSKPWKSTMFAPSETCSPYRAVRTGLPSLILSPIDCCHLNFNNSTCHNDIIKQEFH